MPLVAAKCTQCGASLEVDSSKEAAICPHCHTPFITEKAINNYVTTNNYSTTINAQNVYMADQSEFVVVAGTLKKYRGESADVVVPEGVSSIGTKKEMYEEKLTDFSIFCFTNIRSIKLPKSLTEIDYCDFYDCPKLKKVELADTVTTIGGYAFKDCVSLEEINIPASVKKIGAGTFENCSRLKSISIPEGIEDLSDTFRACSSLENASLPNSVRGLFYTFYNCTALEHITIPNKVTTLYSTFSGCRNLREIEIPTSVKKIKCAFERCSNLKNITVPASVDTIECAFQECENLTSITILGQNTVFDYQSFGGCEKLKTVAVHKKNKKQAKKVLAELKRNTGLKPKLLVVK